MDTERFDALTRRLATQRPSRRHLLRSLGGSLAGAVLAGVRGRPGEAAKGGCKAEGKHCTKPDQCCAGLVCGANGTCQPGLGVGGNCQGLGARCGPSAGGRCCASLVCADADSAGNGVCHEFCANSTTCPSGQTCCGGACEDTQTDPNYCGSCDRACGPGGTCVNGSCVCTAPAIACNGVCVDLQTDPNNCGACGYDCLANTGIAGCQNSTCCFPNGTSCIVQGPNAKCCSGVCTGPVAGCSTLLCCG